MKHRLLLTVSMATAVASVAMVVAQVAPVPPVNLHVVPNNWNPNDTKGPAHEYFNKLVTRPEHYLSYSLRNQAQVDALTSDGDASTTWTYDPANDTYPDKQDALKMTRINPPEGAPGHDKGSVPQHDILNMNSPEWNFGPETDSVIVIWDQYWGPEFRDNMGGVTQLKAAGIQNAGKSWWTMMESGGPASNTADPHDVAMLMDNFAMYPAAYPLAEPMTYFEPMSHTGAEAPSQYPNQRNSQPVFEGRWFRNICEVRPARPASDFVEWNAFYGLTIGPNVNQPSGSWHMVSRWVLDEMRDAHRVMYRVPMGYGINPPRITGMRFTMDSSKTGFIGPWYGYIRNFVVLRNYKLPAVAPEKDTLIFQRPIR